MKTILSLMLIVFLVSCAPFMESPFSDQLLRPDRNLNVTAKQSLGNVDHDGVIRIALFADPHQNYKDLDQIIFKINQTPNVDFTVGLGDVTNSGYNLEYDQFLTAYATLKGPRFMVLGNHDAIGAGLDLFRKSFGPENDFFETATHRFVFFNGNNWELPNDFNPAWLKKAVEDSDKPVIIFSHQQLLDEERYQGEVAATFTDVIDNPKVQLSLNGHNHVYKLVTSQSTLLLQIGRAQGAHWVILEIRGFDLCIKRMDTQEQDCRTLKSYP